MYIINVACKGSHLFATADHSLTDHVTANKVLKVIKEKFPASEGYSISIGYWPKRGVTTDVTHSLDDDYTELIGRLSERYYKK